MANDFISSAMSALDLSDRSFSPVQSKWTFASSSASVVETKKKSLSKMEHIRDVATHLGLMEPERLQEECVRVDRRLMERLLAATGLQSAQNFFYNIMQESNTVITWPPSLKANAKTKKLPFVTVQGLAGNIRRAKEAIYKLLDPRQKCLVTMKLEMDYTDHSDIIGTKGETVSQLMKETECKIHFPDCNRKCSQAKKSNRVAMIGELRNVERARARIRSMTPMTFMFEEDKFHQPDDPYIAEIQLKYPVKVTLKSVLRAGTSRTSVHVKGYESGMDELREAVTLLIHHICGRPAGQVDVHACINVSPEYRSIIYGKNNRNLEAIMARTGTDILCWKPDKTPKQQQNNQRRDGGQQQQRRNSQLDTSNSSDTNAPNSSSKNNNKKPYPRPNELVIKGPVHKVYLAREKLIGSLPIILLFDVPEKTLNTHYVDNANDLMEKYDVFISIREKPKQDTFSVVIKGYERDVFKIYEARRELLKSDEPRIEPVVPKTYEAAAPKTSFLEETYTPYATAGKFDADTGETIRAQSRPAASRKAARPKFKDDSSSIVPDIACAAWTSQKRNDWLPPPISPGFANRAYTPIWDQFFMSSNT
ncbi:hypothetical protein TKK_0014746 [Trichogramma kaykai]|uniref:K Homology domain-containing protein n=1 Tax=Trichogramma kaykai TaxID=54128 RepID=A0ABD2WCG5_9HYME